MTNVVCTVPHVTRSGMPAFRGRPGGGERHGCRSGVGEIVFAAKHWAGALLMTNGGRSSALGSGVSRADASRRLAAAFRLPVDESGRLSVFRFLAKAVAPKRREARRVRRVAGECWLRHEANEASVAGHDVSPFTDGHCLGHPDAVRGVAHGVDRIRRGLAVDNPTIGNPCCVFRSV